MPKVPPVHAEFQVPMKSKYVSLVRKGVRSLAYGAGFNEEDCCDIEVAVGEAVTNAICHGQPKSGAGCLRVRCHADSGYLHIEVEDEGRAACIPLPTRIPDLNDEHGRGWFLIHRLMDGVCVKCTDRGLLVQMIKQRHRNKNVKRHLSSIAAMA